MVSVESQRKTTDTNTQRSQTSSSDSSMSAHERALTAHARTTLGEQRCGEVEAPRIWEDGIGASPLSFRTCQLVSYKYSLKRGGGLNISESVADRVQAPPSPPRIRFVSGWSFFYLVTILVVAWIFRPEKPVSFAPRGELGRPRKNLVRSHGGVLNYARTLKATRDTRGCLRRRGRRMLGSEATDERRM